MEWQGMNLFKHTFVAIFVSLNHLFAVSWSHLQLECFVVNIQEICNYSHHEILNPWYHEEEEKGGIFI